MGMGKSFGIAALVGVGALGVVWALDEGLDRWQRMELDRQEGYFHHNLSDTSSESETHNLICGETSDGIIAVMDAETHVPEEGAEITEINKKSGISQIWGRIINNDASEGDCFFTTAPDGKAFAAQILSI